MRIFACQTAAGPAHVRFFRYDRVPSPFSERRREIGWTSDHSQIWRHLLFYANDARGALDPVKPDSISSSIDAFSSSHLDGSRSGLGIRSLERIASGLRGTLDRLDGIDVVRT